MCFCINVQVVKQGSLDTYLLAFLPFKVYFQPCLKFGPPVKIQCRLPPPAQFVLVIGLGGSGVWISSSEVLCASAGVFFVCVWGVLLGGIPESGFSLLTVRWDKLNFQLQKEKELKLGDSYHGNSVAGFLLLLLHRPDALLCSSVCAYYVSHFIYWQSLCLGFSHFTSCHWSFVLIVELLIYCISNLHMCMF